jgi:D-glycero-D-manno-heptose 1,7-bisphosphate phosphatase
VRRAVFLDRDGTLNRNVWNPATGAYESPLHSEQMELLPGVISALKLLRDAEFLLILVSNQPNAAKGKSSMQTLDAIHAKFEQILHGEGIPLDAVYYCFHHPEFTGPCLCRKPSPYFIFQAQNQFEIDLKSSWMIGDRVTDVQCGRAAGAKTIFLSGSTFSESPATEANYIAPDLWNAAQMILHHHAVSPTGLRVSI